MNNTGPRHPDDRRDALTPEERALAERLARLGPQDEPSPALDARILASARSAAAAPATTVGARTAPRRRQRRWPVAFGAAATLVIVGGLTWQLRPLDEMHVEYSEAPRAASGPSADAVQAPFPVRKAVRVPAPAPAAGVASQPARDAVPASIESTAQPARARSDVASEQSDEATAQADTQARPKAFASKPAAPAEPPVVFDEPSPMDTPSAPREIRQLAPPQPAPPPPAAAAPSAQAAPATATVTAFPQAPVSDSASAAAGASEQENKARAQRARTPEATARRTSAAQVASGAMAQPAKPANAAAAADASTLDRIEIAGTRSEERFNAAGDQPLDDQPPASVDSPQVRQAWLQRVRQLVAEGRPDAARDSLREYQRRYPKATLPDDLRALLDE